MTAVQRTRLDSALASMRNDTPPYPDYMITQMIRLIAKQFNPATKADIDAYLRANRLPV